MTLSRAPIVVQIGFNRCGTLSFHTMMEKSGYSAIHWRDAEERTLAERMVTNLSLGRAPFAGYEGIRVFSDMSHLSGRILIEGARYFRALHTAYPDAYFLFNTRDKRDWLASRAAHSGGRYLQRCCKLAGVGEAEMIEMWGGYYDRHSSEVRAYFSEADARFLEFDLDRDTPERIAEWLSPDFSVDVRQWGHHNRNQQSRNVREALGL
ncbi:sulfotransferase [Celeribacter litoreus]|uniref:sulfotransferase n=1 Tax=Celeribacter litoreus TaxID=2876714 RepID=UPI001CCB9FC0|nr:sulfotransferase [Celeribacter litoreus]MCA0042658.1 hypothetical protein [Celeribacter litoreus]